MAELNDQQLAFLTSTLITDNFSKDQITILEKFFNRLNLHATVPPASTDSTELTQQQVAELTSSHIMDNLTKKQITILTNFLKKTNAHASIGSYALAAPLENVLSRIQRPVSVVAGQTKSSTDIFTYMFVVILLIILYFISTDDVPDTLYFMTDELRYVVYVLSSIAPFILRKLSKMCGKCSKSPRKRLFDRTQGNKRKSSTKRPIH
jgi:hypothetical protein